MHTVIYALLEGDSTIFSQSVLSCVRNSTHMFQAVSPPNHICHTGSLYIVWVAGDTLETNEIWEGASLRIASYNVPRVPSHCAEVFGRSPQLHNLVPWPSTGSRGSGSCCRTATCARRGCRPCTTWWRTTGVPDPDRASTFSPDLRLVTPCGPTHPARGCFSTWTLLLQ